MSSGVATVKKGLVVEDNFINLEVCMGMLEALGYESDSASDGATALYMVETGVRYDFILMDLQMPGMDGIETTRRIRAYEAEHQLPEAPIIAVTANLLPETQQACHEAGMNGYLSKPLFIDALNDAINTALESSSGQG